MVKMFRFPQGVLNLLSPISGKSGVIDVEFIKTGQSKAVPYRVEYQRDDHGLWIKIGDQWTGFDARSFPLDADTVGATPQIQWTLSRRLGFEVLEQLSGQDDHGIGGGGVKKSLLQKLKAPMPGKILKIKVQPGESVKKGQSLLVMEAMKMENELKSPLDGVVKTVNVQIGQTVESHAELIRFGE